MRTIIVQSLITLLLFSNCSNSNPIKGYWVGTMEVNGKTVDFSLNINSEKSSFTSNDMMLLDIPLTSLNYENGTVMFTNSVYDANITFEGKLEKNKISGKMTISEMSPDIEMSFSLVKKSDSPPPKPYTIEELVLENKGINLSAEIYKPKTNLKHPALLLLHGSASGLKAELAFYADYFANQGFEVLIFDKRGYGESTGNSITATYEELAEDAKVCLEKLYNRETVDRGKIGLWGISQGGDVAAICCFQNKNTFISDSNIRRDTRPTHSGCICRQYKSSKL